MKVVSSDIGFVTSFREFSRNTSIRKRAIQEKKPILVEDKREKEFFFLVPSEMYTGLREMYSEWQDARDLQSAMKVSAHESGENWSDIKKELLTK